VSEENYLYVTNGVSKCYVMSVCIINKHVLFQNVMIMQVTISGMYPSSQEVTTLEDIETEIWTWLSMPILMMMTWTHLAQVEEVLGDCKLCFLLLFWCHLPLCWNASCIIYS